jgi:hypothetical protein
MRAQNGLYIHAFHRAHLYCQIKKSLLSKDQKLDRLLVVQKETDWMEPKRLTGNFFTVRQRIHFTYIGTTNKFFIKNFPLEHMVNGEENTPEPLTTYIITNKSETTHSHVIDTN